VNRVSTNDVKLEDYSEIVPERIFTEIKHTANSLKGLRVVHVNATFNGGSVNEILKSLTPLMRDVGIDARWYTLTPGESFYSVCNKLQHALRSENFKLNESDIDLYLANNKKAANTLSSMGVTADVWLFHDFQVLPMLSYMNPCLGLWVCHDGVTELNNGIKDLLLPHMMNYRVIVSSLPKYFTHHHNPCETVIIPPAIDPLLPRHSAISMRKAKEILSDLGIDSNRPVIGHISHFDNWDNLRYIIDAYRIARRKIRGLQLALTDTSNARENQESQGVLAILNQYAGDDPDIYVFSDHGAIGEKEINALQGGVDVIIQHPAHAGFDLRITEAMWKERPVIGGNCDGIRFQIRDGIVGFVVDDVTTCARKIIALLKDPAFAAVIGSAARESVRKKYLMPRLLRDYLKLFSRLTNGQDKVLAGTDPSSRKEIANV